MLLRLKRRNKKSNQLETKWSKFLIGYGKMNLDDFLDLMEGQIRANASDRNVENLPAATVAFMLEAFRMFDNDKDGYLNMEELKVKLMKLKDFDHPRFQKACSLIGDESAAEALMEDADHNKDHKLDFDGK